VFDSASWGLRFSFVQVQFRFQRESAHAIIRMPSITISGIKYFYGPDDKSQARAFRLLIINGRKRAAAQRPFGQYLASARASTAMADAAGAARYREVSQRATRRAAAVPPSLPVNYATRSVRVPLGGIRRLNSTDIVAVDPMAYSRIQPPVRPHWDPTQEPSDMRGPVGPASLGDPTPFGSLAYETYTEDEAGPYALPRSMRRRLRRPISVVSSFNPQYTRDAPGFLGLPNGGL